MPGVEHLTLTLDDVEAELIVTGVHRWEYDLLLEQHPPRPAELAPFNEATFPPALLAACTGQPVEVTDRWWQTWPADTADDVFETCHRLSAPGAIDWATRRLQRDARLRLEVRYCNAHGLPHDTFLRWPDRSQDLALAGYLLEQNRCPGCGVPADAMDDPDAADVEQQECVHCDLREQVAKAVPEGDRSRIHTYVVPAAVKVG